jgi:hypothetical protein
MGITQSWMAYPLTPPKEPATWSALTDPPQSTLSATSWNWNAIGWREALLAAVRIRLLGPSMKGVVHVIAVWSTNPVPGFMVYRPLATWVYTLAGASVKFSANGNRERLPSEAASEPSGHWNWPDTEASVGLVSVSMTVPHLHSRKGDGAKLNPVRASGVVPPSPALTTSKSAADTSSPLTA